MPTTRRTVVRRPFVHVRLTLFEVLCMWWHGRRDARRNVPLLASDGGSAVTTPQVQSLLHQAREAFEAERINALQDVSALVQRRYDLEHARLLLDERHQQARSEEPPPLTVAEREHRRAAERDLDLAIVVKRRLREHEQLTTSRRERTDRLRQQLQKVDAQLEGLPDLVAQRHAEAAVRVHQCSNHTARKIAVYWRALVRRHAQGPKLAAAWRPAVPTAPQWLGGTTQEIPA